MTRLLCCTLFLLFATVTATADHHEEGEAKTAMHPFAVEVKTQLGKRPPEKPFVLLVTLKPKQGQAGKVIAAMKKATPLTRKEEGNTAYLLLQSPTEKNDLLVFERWKSLAALDAHVKQPYITELMTELEDVLAEPPGLSVMKPTYFGGGK